MTGRMNNSRAACVAPLSTELTTPANRMANATIAIDATASQSGRETIVPSEISTTPAAPSTA